VLIAHPYNASYSGGRHQEDQSSKPAKANSSRDSISKKPVTQKTKTKRTKKEETPHKNGLGE
jgi:hypothetical protein